MTGSATKQILASQDNTNICNQSQYKYQQTVQYKYMQEAKLIQISNNMRLLDIFSLGPSHRSSSCMRRNVKKIYLGNVDFREVPSCICAVEIAHFLHNWLQVCYRDITGRSSIIACDCTSSTIFPWLHSLVFVRWLHLYLCVDQIIFVLDSLKLMGGASISQPAFDFFC